MPFFNCMVYMTLFLQADLAVTGTAVICLSRVAFCVTSS
ncbi:hypothetical protein predicted by Glimmer/Critica [Salmonella enterica subsp. enterica serovar Weltevreden str. 2007-60-3289-1]|uniref:Uncharacterized protein n=2 Tax=Salmonella enterica I TaxID=59201 RepID=A0A6C8GRK9_SALET|nr:hypothetical protein SeHA_C0765 [Salmonella enterica subsp. enterica serovar Heidelberg str. SL476]AEZ46018.1 hypothetical protein STBHUCCB_23450 [Salmonella enterica subsp. enterica serovar Typhi str. P-stx-12]AXR54981.1 hypothetical protein CJP42_3412 [Salmonella enterica subsp. enterica serovar Typhi]EDZ27165.1 hypothetical protein SeHB_A0721 [Salmonella enterica subsp. enterica serovar Heidelberg str. SL486]EDZ29828.1 hypothetical protein SeW_A0743 [Salmonella enterica subsp. enterica se